MNELAAMEFQKNLLDGRYHVEIPKERVSHQMVGSKPVVDQMGEFVGFASNDRGAKISFVRDVRKMIKDGDLGQEFNIRSNKLKVIDAGLYYVILDESVTLNEHLQNSYARTDLERYLEPYFKELVERNTVGDFVDIPIPPNVSRGVTLQAAITWMSQKWIRDLCGNLPKAYGMSYVANPGHYRITLKVPLE